jgi:hypothetical protein
VTLWIRIHIENLDPRSMSRGKKINKIRWKTALFVLFLNFISGSYKIPVALSTVPVLENFLMNTGTGSTGTFDFLFGFF